MNTQDPAIEALRELLVRRYEVETQLKRNCTPEMEYAVIVKPVGATKSLNVFIDDEFIDDYLLHSRLPSKIIEALESSPCRVILLHGDEIETPRAFDANRLVFEPCGQKA